MGAVANLRTRAGSPAAQAATYRAMLRDTVDLLRGLSYQDDASRVAAEAQAEAIIDILAA